MGKTATFSPAALIRFIVFLIAAIEGEIEDHIFILMRHHKNVFVFLFFS